MTTAALLSKKEERNATSYSDFEKVGGGAGIRTPDTANMSRMLYHLSYTAMLKTMLNKVKKNSN